MRLSSSVTDESVKKKIDLYNDNSSSASVSAAKNRAKAIKWLRKNERKIKEAYDKGEIEQQVHDKAMNIIDNSRALSSR